MPSTPEELNQIGFLLGRAYYSYIRLLEQALDETGLGEHCKPGMGSLLLALFREDDRTIGDIGRELGLARSTMTGMVARMRKAGLITEHRDAHDGRAVRIRLTPLARSLEERCHNLAQRIEALLCQGLDAQQQRRLRHALGVVTRNINRQLQQADTKTNANTRC
jgi:DNA-binding MarR family transcriptional regulator